MKNTQKTNRKTVKCFTIGIVLLFLMSDSSPGQQSSEASKSKAVPFRIFTAKQLLDKIVKGEKMNLIDCRPHKEYKAAHIPGAKNVSMDSFTFDKDTAIKASLERIQKEAQNKIQFTLIDSETGEEYMSLSKLVELMACLPEDRNEEVIFYCREPT